MNSNHENQCRGSKHFPGSVGFQISLILTDFLQVHKKIYTWYYILQCFFLSFDMTFDQSIFSENHAMYDRELTNHRSYIKSFINYLPLIEKSGDIFEAVVCFL